MSKETVFANDGLWEGRLLNNLSVRDLDAYCDQNKITLEINDGMIVDFESCTAGGEGGGVNA